LELKQLARTLLSTDSGPARRALKDKIKAYNRGELPYAKDILPALYRLMESDAAFEEPARSTVGGMATAEFRARPAAKRVPGHVTCRAAATTEVQQGF